MNPNYIPTQDGPTGPTWATGVKLLCVHHSSPKGFAAETKQSQQRHAQSDTWAYDTGFAIHAVMIENIFHYKLTWELLNASPTGGTVLARMMW